MISRLASAAGKEIKLWTATPGLMEWKEKLVGVHGWDISSLVSDVENETVIAVANDIQLDAFSTGQGSRDPDLRRAKGVNIDWSKKKEEYFRIWDAPGRSTAVFTRDLPVAVACIPPNKIFQQSSASVAVATVSSDIRVFRLAELQITGGNDTEYLPGRGIRGTMHRGYIKALSSNGRYLVSASADTTAKIWQLVPHQLLTEVVVGGGTNNFSTYNTSLFIYSARCGDMCAHLGCA